MSSPKFLPGQFVLYISHADASSQSTLISGRYKGLFSHDDSLLPVQEVDGRDGIDGWYINDNRVPGGRFMIKDLYLQSKPDFEGKVTLPLLSTLR